MGSAQRLLASAPCSVTKKRVSPTLDGAVSGQYKLAILGMKRAELKAHLKAWERDFLAERGRRPDKADIRADARIYKCYRDYDRGRASSSELLRARQEDAMNGESSKGPLARQKTAPNAQSDDHSIEVPDTPTPRSSSRASSSSIRREDVDSYGAPAAISSRIQSFFRTPSEAQKGSTENGHGLSDPSLRESLQGTPKTARRLFGNGRQSADVMPFQSPQKIRQLIRDISKGQSPKRSPAIQADADTKSKCSLSDHMASGKATVDLSPLPLRVRQSMSGNTVQHEESIRQLKAATGTPRKERTETINGFATIDPTPVKSERKGGRAFRALLHTPTKMSENASDVTNGSGAVQDSMTTSLDDTVAKPSSPWKKRKRMIDGEIRGDRDEVRPATNPFAKHSKNHGTTHGTSQNATMDHQRRASHSRFWDSENDVVDAVLDGADDDGARDCTFEDNAVLVDEDFDGPLDGRTFHRLPSFGTQALDSSLVRRTELGRKTSSEDEWNDDDDDELPDPDIIDGMSRGVTRSMDDL